MKSFSFKESKWLLLGLAFCSLIIYMEFFPLKEKHYTKSLNKNLEAALEKGSQEIIVSTIVDFKWDKVCFVQETESHRMGPHGKIYKILGKDYAGYVPGYTCQHDSSYHTNSLLFLNDKKVLMILPVYDCRIEHDSTNDNGCYGPDAFFKVTNKQFSTISDGNIFYKEITIKDSP